VKVRILHDQTGELGKKKKTLGITDAELLWAWPISSIQSASLSHRKIRELEKFETPFWIDAVGTSPTGIAVGTYVFGFYLDGHEGNIPVIFGTYHKDSMYPEPPTDKPTGEMLQIEPPTGPTYEYQDVAGLAKGWHDDPQREFNHPMGQDVINVTAPNEGGQTLPKHYNEESTPKGYQKGLMNLVYEPPSDYDTEYPFNFVHTTKSGHAIELDDTPGHERIHWWHRSGSYDEISNGPPGKNRDGLVGKEYPFSMGPGGYTELAPGLEAPQPKWEGRRVRKTTENEYNIVIGNKETLVNASLNLEVHKNKTTGVGNNHIETIANNVYIAVGYYPRTANNDLAGESARYQNKDIIKVKETDKRTNTDKVVKELPETRKYDFITDVANNVQLSIGWTWKKGRELDVHSEKNNVIEIANNQMTSIGWIPLNNYDGDKEARQLTEKEKTSYYLDVKNNSVTNIGWKPFDEGRTILDTDIVNKYTDVKNNLALNIGYDPQGDDARKLDGEDVTSLYIDVKNNSRQTIGNNYYLTIGNKPKDEWSETDKDGGSYFVGVSNKMATRVGTDQAWDIRGNMSYKVIGNSLFDLHGLAVINAHNELVLNSAVGITLQAPSTTILGPLFVKDGMGTEKAATGSFAALNGTVVTVTNGIITSIDPV
jgi:hypothetical protein